MFGSLDCNKIPGARTTQPARKGVTYPESFMVFILFLGQAQIQVIWINSEVVTVLWLRLRVGVALAIALCNDGPQILCNT